MAGSPFGALRHSQVAGYASSASRRKTNSPRLSKNRRETNIRREPPAPRMKNLWRSGIIFTAISFLTLLIGYGFQTIVSRQLGGTTGEYGLALTTITFIGFLGLPLAIATQAVTHYIARFHFSGDDARLDGLLAGCRKFLFNITIAGSIIAIILVKPLGHYFNIPRTSLTVIALVCVLANLWGSYVTVLCQGLGWFKRPALVGLLAAILRILFGGLATKISPVAECAVLASAVMLLANLVLLFWKKDFPRRTEIAVSPWNPEFVQFLIVSAACVGGGYFFTQGDQLVANKFFSKNEIDAYGSAGLLAARPPPLFGPLPAVFIHAPFQPQPAPRRRLARTIEIARPLRLRSGFRRDHAFCPEKILPGYFAPQHARRRRDDRKVRGDDGFRRTASGARHMGAGKPLDKNFTALRRTWTCL